MQALWEALLKLRIAAQEQKKSSQWLSLHYDTGSFGCAFDQWVDHMPRENQLGIWWGDHPCPDQSHADWLHIPHLYRAELHTQRAFTSEEVDLLQNYLPYSLLPLAAHSLGRTIAVTHFAQTLDGKIATHEGDSRWIGNWENLVHAHRMRALCQGILIGAQTLVSDRPSLTVRHVSGPNPVRIVVGSSARDFDCLWESSDASVVWVSKEQALHDERLTFQAVPCQNGHLNCLDILECLYRDQGITSVYIEGGAQTTSYFLQDKAVDIMQLHLSPQIFGSGISAVQLPTIDKVAESLEFDPCYYQRVGDQLMFVGQLKRD